MTTHRRNTQKARKPASQKRQGSTPLRETRASSLLKLLRTPKGATLEEICKRFDWQRHSARAALSGLRKAGHEITRVPGDDGKPARYRVEGTRS